MSVFNVFLEFKINIVIIFSGKKPVYMERGMTRPMAASPKFIQGKREKSKDFMKRVEVETRKVLHRHQLSQKFKVLSFICAEFQCEHTPTHCPIASLSSFLFIQYMYKSKKEHNEVHV